MIVGIDASRNRSGGAKVHLLGILGDGEPLKFGIKEVHVWSYPALLGLLPEKPWLIKHSHPALGKSILHQLFWQRYNFPDELRKSKCDIVLNTDAGTISVFRPSVTMSRDMLSYEPGEMKRYAFTLAGLRLLCLRMMQNRSLRKCDGALFLTKYAADVIQQSCGKVQNVALIPHGVSDAFKDLKPAREWPVKHERAIRCLYISNAELYKHQWHVIRAVAQLRAQGVDLELTLVGGGNQKALAKIEDELGRSDPDRKFVKMVDFVEQESIVQYLVDHDLFVFASSCENMPNTLVEGMAAGMPIVCSDRGPMPEVLLDGGIYFDPEDFHSIASAIKIIVENSAKREFCASRAKLLAQAYSWKRCSSETWKFIVDTYKGLAV